MTRSDPTELVADDWATLQELLYRDSWNESLGRHRSPYVFRGLPDAGHGLETRLQRFVGDSGEWELEGHLLRNFLHYARQEIDPPESPFHLMALGQHHGLPTRLLDWSYSPAVATYFATGGDPDADGVVWAVDYEAAHEHLPEHYQAFREELGVDVFDAGMLYDLVRGDIDRSDIESTLADRRGISSREISDVIAAFSSQDEAYVVFFQPPSTDQRIVNQAALFSAVADPRTAMDDWLDRHPELFWKIVIPAERKREFRDKLDQANVNHRTLFPDLDGIATWLTEYYRPE